MDSKGSKREAETKDTKKSKKAKLEEEEEEEECIIYKAVSSPSKLPKCSSTQLLAFNPEQINSLISKTTIKGKVGLVNVDTINSYVIYLHQYSIPIFVMDLSHTIITVLEKKLKP
jgi:hypothetical protein